MKTYKKTIEDKRLKITYCDNTSPLNPREWDNLGFFLTSSKNRISPDENQELYQIMMDAYKGANSVQEHIENIKKRLKKSKNNFLNAFPVSKYEHGCVRYSLGTTQGFEHCVCGFYFVPLNEETHSLSYEETIKVINRELELYSQWANGYVYQYELFDEQGNLIDDYDGFYDIEEIRNLLPKEWENENLENYMCI